MTDTEWAELLADLHAIETDEDVDRAVAASIRLGELDDRSRLPDLKALVETADFFILEAIGVPIANLEGLAALPLLLRALDRGHEQGHDCDGLGSTISDLISTEPEDSAPILLEMLRSGDDRTRANAAWLLGYAADAIDPGPLLGVLHDAHPKVRSAAAGSLGSFGSRSDVFDALTHMLNDPDEQVRVSTISSLGYLGDQRAIDALEGARSDPAERVRQFADYAIKQLSDNKE